MTGGRASDTGLAGLALGSGSGWLERKLGFTCDNLFKAEVVTADGRQVVASRGREPRAVLGAARRRRQLRRGHGLPLPPARGRPDRARRHAARTRPPMAGDLVRFYRDFMRAAPDEVGTGLAFITAPPEEFVPEPARGQPVVGVIVCYAGPAEEGEEALRPLREFGPPAARHGSADALRRRAAAARRRKSAGRSRTTGRRTSSPSSPTRRSTRFAGHATNPVSPLTQILLFPVGGAIARVDDDAMRVRPARAPPGTCTTCRCGPIPAETEPNIAYTRAIASAMKPWTTGGVVPELHRRRGLRPGRGRLRAGEVRPAAGAQGRVGPDQPVPPQPEHPAQRGVRG